MIGMGSGKTESRLHYVNHLWLSVTISRKGLNTPFIFSVSCYFIQDFVVRATTIIFERKRSQDTNMDKSEVCEGGGNIFVGKHSVHQRGPCSVRKHSVQQGRYILLL